MANRPERLFEIFAALCEMRPSIGVDGSFPEPVAQKKTPPGLTGFLFLGFFKEGLPQFMSVGSAT